MDGANAAGGRVKVRQTARCGRALSIGRPVPRRLIGSRRPHTSGQSRGSHAQSTCAAVRPSMGLGLPHTTPSSILPPDTPGLSTVAKACQALASETARVTGRDAYCAGRLDLIGQRRASHPPDAGTDHAGGPWGKAAFVQDRAALKPKKPHETMGLFQILCRMSARNRLNAWRTGSSCVPWPCRTSYARPHGCRGSGSLPLSARHAKRVRTVAAPWTRRA